MIYDDQEQMVEAMKNRLVAIYGFIPNPSIIVGKKPIEDAFAVIDREALIEKVQDEWKFLSDVRGLLSSQPSLIEATLIAAGIIPERES